MFFRKRTVTSLAGVFCAAALSACVSGNPRTLYELSKFDPLSADPAGIAVAVKTDRKLHLRQGDVMLRMALASEDKNRAFDESFVLTVIGDKEPAGFGQALKPNEHVLSAAIAAEDRQRFRAAQARARAARAEDATEGKGSISVSINGGCTSGPLDLKDTTVRSYMRTQAGGRFFPLTGEMKITEVLGNKKSSAIRIPSCEIKLSK